MYIEPKLLDAINRAFSEPPSDYIHHQGWVLIAFQNALYQLLHAPSLCFCILKCDGYFLPRGFMKVPI